MKTWGYLIAITMLIAGFTKSYTLYKNPTATELDFRKYSIMLMAKESAPSWVTLTKCNLDLTDAVYFQSRLIKNQKPKEILVPIKSISNVDSMVHMALLLIKDEKSISVYNKLIELENEDEIFAFINKNRSILFRENINVEGLAQDWMDKDENETSELREAYPKLHKNFVIIEEDQTPTKFSLLLIPLGIILMILLIFSGRNKNQS